MHGSPHHQSPWLAFFYVNNLYIKSHMETRANVNMAKSSMMAMLVSHICEHYVWFVNSVSLCSEDLTSKSVSRKNYFKRLFKLVEGPDLSKKTLLVCQPFQVFWIQNHYLFGPYDSCLPWLKFCFQTKFLYILLCPDIGVSVTFRSPGG